ncbi:MAG: ribosome silencing factor [Nitrospinaceae bacterium]|nr:ribosome silencing factor [Nitrospinaceae bacterium]NIR55707.1 ribosome silencing factor [Nitrospinaceae bacterium]NIS86151.1 ribosome silencing factor [Nitrospinaceae bacterium]NIT82995.1 ribosome silencing factor [Nitrospinaceae bacterium]NIU45199.1 ribosome silencing factor [Nitrospinaceae bacterium]
MKESLSELQQLVLDAVTEKKATDIIILDLRNRTDLTDFFLICSGQSKVQVQAIADNILEKSYDSSYKVLVVEGHSTGNWIILDMGDLIAHVFHKEVRRHYDLERLWGDVPVIAEMSGS